MTLRAVEERAESGAEAPPDAAGAVSTVGAIWAQLLPGGPFAEDDDFFARGGHSLLATRLASRLRQELGVEVPLAALFEEPTLGGQVRLVEALRRGEAPSPGAVPASLRPLASPRPAAPRGRRLVRRARSASRSAGPPPPAPPLVRAASAGEPLPLSFGQERLWFLDRLAPGSPFYNVPLAFRIAGELGPRGVAALGAALGEVVRRHEALRTRFAADGEEPRAIVLPPRRWAAPPTADLGALAPERREEAVAAALAAASRRPFDLAAGPPLTSLLIRHGGARHELLVTVHHIAFDGWSLGVLRDELGALFRAAIEGRPSPLPELAVQYGDFTLWQRRWLSGEVLAAHLDAWGERLEGCETALDLVGDRPRPSIAGQTGARVVFALPGGLGARLAARAREQRASGFMVFAAAFAALLHRITGQEDLLLGTPVAGRGRSELEPLIGFFVNTVALRCDLAGEPDFAQLLGRVRASSLHAFSHQELPFEKLVEELAPERDPSRSPLVQALVAFQSDAPARLDLGPGLAATLEPLPTGTAKVDLTLFVDVAAAGGEATLKLEYRTDLFDRATVRRLAGHLESLLVAVAAEPHRPLSELELLSAAERQQALVEWNDTRSAYPRRAVHHLFEEQAAARPDAVAVEWEGGALSYGALDRRAGDIARRLRDLGVGRGSRVGLAAERSAEMVAAVLAILKAGGAYVPLDAAYPRERLALLLADAAPAALVGEGRLLDRLPSPASRLALDAPEVAAAAVALETSAAEPADPETGPDDLAYVLYTSGSTGVPKGVEVPHRAVARLVRETGYAPFGPQAVFLQLAPMSFDAATLELWGPLANGGRLALFPPRPFSLAELYRALDRHRVTVLWLTAGLFHLAVEEDPSGLAGLEQLLAGGDVLSRAHVERALAALPGVALMNGYGPTENTTFSACHRVRGGAAGAAVPIGRPIAGSRAYVLDRSLAPLPAGCMGEICVGGEGLARGYLARPALTAERFVPSPFGGVEGAAGERLYRTGDLARWRPDGTLEFLGRADNQVKVRGFRVEPGEVESALRGHPGVGEAAVLALDDGAGDRRLVACFAPRAAGSGEGAAAPGEPELREYLRARLPAHLLPSRLLAFPALPLNANGKVDRHVLADLATAALAAGADGEDSAGGADMAPRTPGERLLARLWAEVLSGAHPGRGSDFFDLGGNSLLAARLASRLRQELGRELPIALLFQAPVLADQALLLATPEGAAAGGPLDPITRACGAEAGPRPLSAAQEQLWFLDRLFPGSPLYNVPLAVRLEGRLGAREVAALGAALSEIARRHEALRTVYAADGAGVSARALPPRAIALPLADLSSLPSPRREAAARRLLDETARLPFDLAATPLRTLLVRRGEAAHDLVVNVHHIAFDGWSLDLLGEELGALYRATLAGLPSPLPEPPVQYADFALWQRRWLAGEECRRHLDFWRRQLAGRPPDLDLPADRPRPPVASHRGAQRRAALPDELARRLARLSRRHGATRFMALAAGLAALLGRYSGQTDVLFGTPVANRHRDETERLIGLLVNTVVLRLDLGGEIGFGALLDRAHGAAVAAFAHQELPFETLVADLAPARDPSRSPLVQVILAYQGEERLERALDLGPGLAAALAPLATGTAKFDLTLAAEEAAGGGVALTLEHSADLFDATTVLRLAGHLETLLAGAVADPDRPLAELPLLTAAELAQLAEWRAATREPAPGAAFLHRLFAAQAARTPRAVALVDGRERLTYAELDSRTSRLARRLRARGVGPDSAVALLLPCSALLPVAMLAVLKAGGFYVALDPAYPEERLAYMLADSGARVVLVGGGLAPPAASPAPEVLRLDAGPGDEPGARDSAQAADDLATAEVEVDGANLAYAIYTSGSTGRPKGVALTHRGAAFLAAWARQVFSREELRGVLASTSAGFDMSVFEIFVTLAWGGTAILADHALALADLPAAAEVTLVDTVPSVLAAMLREGPLPPGVRTVSLGGEPLPAALAERVHALPGPPRLVNVYGPTEDTVFSTWAAIERGSRRAPGIGRALRGGWTAVLDAAGRPLPIGVPGELCLGGGGLARGYFGRPDLTAERFVPAPEGLAEAPGERLYRTGDVARFLPDGSLDFLGRRDQQVKVRGFRVELGEIEAALAACPGVAAAAVRLEGSGAGARLVAYAAPAGLAAAELRAALRERLPDYMVPAAWVLLPALPLTASGKVDRRALPAGAPATLPEGGPESSYVAPSTAAERAIAEVWAEVLGLPRVGVEANFFELGGDSIRALQVVARCRQHGIELAPRDLFREQTVAALAVLATAASTSASGAEAAAGTLPLTAAQEAVLAAGSAVREAGDALLVELPPAIAPPVLARALDLLAARHAALRLRLVETAGGPRRTVAPAEAGQVPLERRELPAGLANLADLATGVRARLDPAAGPLLYAVLLADPAGGPDRLLLAAHPLAVDLASWPLLLADLASAYASISRGDVAPEHPAVPVPSDEAAAPAPPAAAGMERPMRLPLDLGLAEADGAGRNAEGDARTFVSTLSADAAAGLLAAAPERAGAGLQEALLAALAAAFAPWTGTPRLEVEVEAGGRAAGAPPVVGRHASPRRAVVAAGSGAEESLRLAREALLQARPFAPSSRPEVCLRVYGDLGAGWPAEPLPLSRPAAAPRAHRIEVEARLAVGELHVVWHYGERLHRRETIEALAERCLRALRGLARTDLAAPVLTPSDFPLAGLDQAELDDLLGDLA